MVPLRTARWSLYGCRSICEDFSRTGKSGYDLLSQRHLGAIAYESFNQIKIRSNSLPVKYTEDGLECANGERIPADVVVFATGFVGNLRLVVADVFGVEVAAQVEDYWGMNDEGELRGAFKPSGRTYLTPHPFLLKNGHIRC